MKEHLSNAALAISCGADVDEVIEACLSEGKWKENWKLFKDVASKSMYTPSKNVFVPKNIFAPSVGYRRYRIPGGLMGIGAMGGAAIKGIVAHHRAKRARLKGKEYAKYLGKNIVKGAGAGALVGYAAQLSQRAAASKAARRRHLVAKWSRARTRNPDLPGALRTPYRTKGVRRAGQELERLGAQDNLKYYAGIVGMSSKRALGFAG